MKKDENKDVSIKEQDLPVEDEVLENDKENDKNEEKDEKTLLTEEIASLNDLLLRSKAELDNFQKRTIKQIQQAQLYSTEKLSAELMVIMDSLEAA